MDDATARWENVTMKTDRDLHSLDAIAERLIALRLVKGLTQGVMADLAGISRPAWNNYEQGIRRIDIEPAKQLRKLYGVSLDWIYEGDPAGMPYGLMQQLDQHSVVEGTEAIIKRRRHRRGE